MVADVVFFENCEGFLANKAYSLLSDGEKTQHSMSTCLFFGPLIVP